MSKQQLEKFKQKVGANPNLQQNGRLLHMREVIGGHNEWSVFTYNLQVLGDMARENTELRKKHEKLLQMMAPMLPAGGGMMPSLLGMNNPSGNTNQSFLGSGLGSLGAFPNFMSPNMNFNLMVMLLAQKMEDMMSRLDKLEQAQKG
ncbi:hypothetical protein CDL15_Pgr009341 [Punica granatum]|uniref:Uncharacterized protein n=1 Tax=Punica granatum TaxID=22663 RepID=A0A218XGP9_PUNGR|nr:hypothetical protein CDL15_Pgr009341 [Punica granatum]